MNRIKTILLISTIAMTSLSACSNMDTNKNNSADTLTHQPEHQVHADSSQKYEVKVTSGPQVIEAGKPTKLSIAVIENGKNVALEVVHEMKMHVLVVNEELTWFDHIHPEEMADGSYNVSETFPAAGKYLLFTDYKPNGAKGAVDKKTIEVKGASTLKTAELKTKLISEVDGFRVTLLNGDDFKTNRSQGLQFAVEKDGKKLEEKDMQKYLGATAHIVMIGKVDNDFLHIHPVSEKRFPIYAETHIEKAGIYRMWVQFQLDNKVHTADFTITVSEGDSTGEAHSQHKH